MKSVDRNTKIICDYYDGCSLGDVDRMSITLHEDVTHYFLAPNVGSKPVSGRLHLARFWRKVASMIDARWVVDNSITMGDQTVIEWTLFWQPTGVDGRVATRGAEWFVFKDGLIYEVRSYYQQKQHTTELDAFPYQDRLYSFIGQEFSDIHQRVELKRM